MTVKQLRWIGTFAILLIPVVARAQDEVVYYHTDAIGTVRMITDANGAEIARYDFLPFGQPWPPPQNPPDVRQFAGKELDPETKLDYFGARYYRADSARFTTVDPILDPEKAVVDPQLWSRYAYGRNNPTKFVDPDGREIWLSSAHQRALMVAGQRATPAVVIGATVAAATGLIYAGPIAWRAVVGCFLSASCQSAVTTAVEEMALGAQRPSPIPFSASAAARTFGMVGELAESGSLVSGRLANGATVAASFSKVGDTFAVNISMLANVRDAFGTLALVQQGIVNAAREAGAATIKVTASMVTNPRLANVLRLKGYVEVEAGKWVKEIPLP